MNMRLSAEFELPYFIRQENGVGSFLLTVMIVLHNLQLPLKIRGLPDAAILRAVSGSFIVSEGC